MSASDLLSSAVAAVQALEAEPSARTFRKLTREFVDAVAQVPDYPAADFTAAEIERLSTMAESVIAAIERRLQSDDDRAAVQVELAETIYDIRRGLEQIAMWRKHNLQS